MFNRKDGVKRFKITVSSSLIIYLTVFKKEAGRKHDFLPASCCIHEC
ncbi:hypothetical protein HMPREF0511_0358 [Limosilactobacillus fermentum ATCC 14931]|nr:hypothetical protein HMPREF0511_0358 [Limosilactobacillus fermentum ATCC 14931]